jgi:hypothetical protein
MIPPKIRPCRSTMRPRPNGVLLSRLQLAPVGFWLSISLSAVEGGHTPTAKLHAVREQARQLFQLVETKIEGSRLLVRRLPCRPDPNRHPVFYRVRAH